MTPAQQTALEHPCRLGIETLHPRYMTLRGDHSVTVTVNTGYE